MKRWPIECLKIKVEGGGVELGLFEEWFEPTASNEPDDTRAQTHVKLDISALEEPSRFLAAVELLPIKPIEKVFFIGGSHECQDPMIVEYIGKLGTVQELSIDVPSLPTFFMSTSEQVDQLQRLIEGEDIGEVGSTLSAEKIALGQGLVLFHGLRDLTIYGELDGETLTREAAIILQTWLEWRKRFNLQLDQLFISGVSTPPGAWLAGLFDGLVGDLQTKNLTWLVGHGVPAWQYESVLSNPSKYYTDCSLIVQPPQI
ncbi:hypothetical protein BDN72DRAFT_965310 [Pluteus cervinus]|uniref:Uncharacterized protein n=1 Tax=Pluteus cervinus TaxID=181527 RepID=A0ACD3A5N9_9AGAR|nr:hypothetical protein BDN72DRAFT_965310 [Pluteus cervinus]